MSRLPLRVAKGLRARLTTGSKLPGHPERSGWLVLFRELTVTTMIQSQNLRADALKLNIDDERYQWIVDHVESAIASFFANGGNLDVYTPDCKIDIFALTLMNCCDRGDEAQFFCDAVESILQEKYAVAEETSFKIARFLGHRCVQLADARRAVESKPKSSGCVIVTAIGMVGLSAFGYSVGRLFVG